VIRLCDRDRKNRVKEILYTIRRELRTDILRITNIIRVETHRGPPVCLSRDSRVRRSELPAVARAVLHSLEVSVPFRVLIVSVE